MSSANEVPPTQYIYVFLGQSKDVAIDIKSKSFPCRKVQADSCQSWNQISTDLIKKVCTYIFLKELVDYFLYRERIIYLLIYRYSNSKLKSQKIMISVNVTRLQSKDLRKTQNCYRFFDFGFLCQMKTTHFFKDIYFLRNWQTQTKNI